jgi:hypothetical protein
MTEVKMINGEQESRISVDTTKGRWNLSRLFNRNLLMRIRFKGCQFSYCNISTLYDGDNQELG